MSHPLICLFLQPTFLTSINDVGGDFFISLKKRGIITVSNNNGHDDDNNILAESPHSKKDDGQLHLTAADIFVAQLRKMGSSPAEKPISSVNYYGSNKGNSLNSDVTYS